MSTSHNFFKENEGRAEAESSWGPSAYQPNTLLLGQTGSLVGWFVDCFYIALFSALKQTYCILVACDSGWATVAFVSVFYENPPRWSTHSAVWLLWGLHCINVSVFSPGKGSVVSAVIWTTLQALYWCVCFFPREGECCVSSHLDHHSMDAPIQQGHLLQWHYHVSP